MQPSLTQTLRPAAPKYIEFETPVLKETKQTKAVDLNSLDFECVNVSTLRWPKKNQQRNEGVLSMTCMPLSTNNPTMQFAACMNVIITCVWLYISQKLCKMMTSIWKLNLQLPKE